jgi:hypothetical protein
MTQTFTKMMKDGTHCHSDALMSRYKQSRPESLTAVLRSEDTAAIDFVSKSQTMLDFRRQTTREQ